MKSELDPNIESALETLAREKYEASFEELYWFTKGYQEFWKMLTPEMIAPKTDDKSVDRQQGVWEPHEQYDPEMDDGTEVYYTCSVCGRVEYSPEHFCPECGSEMTAGELD